MNQSKASIETILAEAVEIACEEERRQFVAKACAGDTALQHRVERLITDHFRAGNFLERPAGHLADAGAFTPSSEAARDTAVVMERPGTVIGPYKLLEQIGEGGMGLVFMAEQMQPIRRRVALKVLKPGLETRQVVARFEAERQALALMDHPHIAKIFDAGVTGGVVSSQLSVVSKDKDSASSLTTDNLQLTTPGRPYFVMELVRGVPITDYCDKRRLATRQRLELFVTVCHAVQHAHHKGIIHRDLKPSNVLVTQHDTVAVPKIIDFGIAKATSQPLTERTLFTNFAQMIGTPLYMSPEQAEMSGLDVDTRSDVYSLGVLLYELLTGTTPFENETLKKVGLDEMRRMIREDEPPTPSKRLSTLSAQVCLTVSERRGVDGRRLGQMLRGELDWIVMKALEKDRDRRYESASALAADIQRYLNDESVTACPPTARYRLRKYMRRNRRTLIPAAIVALALVAGTAVSAWQAARAREAQRQAEANAKAARRAVDKMYLQVAEKWLGKQPLMHQVQKEFVEEVLHYYQEFSLQEMKDRDSRFETAVANQRAGTILNYAFSEKKLAREALLRARGALEQLAEEYPEEPEYVFELARTYSRLAHTLHRDSAGKNLEEEDLRQSVRLLDQLLDRFPAEPRYRFWLAASLVSLCNPLIYAGKWQDVRETSRQALALLESLIREAPDREYFVVMSDGYQHLAEALARGDGNMTGAIESTRNAIASLERLANDASSDPEYQHALKAFDWHMLGRNYRDLGRRLEQMEDYEGAEKAHERSLRIYVRLAADFPNMPDFQEALADCYRTSGQFCNRQGKRSEGKEMFRQAAKIEELLRGGDGKVP
jgi:serine/threonine protein kinase